LEIRGSTSSLAPRARALSARPRVAVVIPHENRSARSPEAASAAAPTMASCT